MHIAAVRVGLINIHNANIGHHGVVVEDSFLEGPAQDIEH